MDKEEQRRKGGTPVPCGVAGPGASVCRLPRLVAIISVYMAYANDYCVHETKQFVGKTKKRSEHLDGLILRLAVRIRPKNPRRRTSCSSKVRPNITISSK